MIVALKTLSQCTSELDNGPLKVALSDAAATMLKQVAEQVQHVVCYLVRNLQTTPSGDQGCQETLATLWTLRKLADKSKDVERWIKEANGLQYLLQILIHFQENQHVQEEGAWLAYTVAGLDGLVELLSALKQRPGTVEAVAWILKVLAENGCSDQEDWTQEGEAKSWEHVDAIIGLLLDAMQVHASSASLLQACCAALLAIVQDKPVRGSALVLRGGDAVVLGVLEAARNLGAGGEDLLVVALQLVAALVQGNDPVARRLQERGAVKRLLECGGLVLPGPVMAATLQAISKVGGVLQLIDIMQHPEAPKTVLLGALETLSKVAWTDSVEGSHRKPLALSLEQLTAAVQRAVAVENTPQANNLAVFALGGVANSVGTLVAPGTLPALDRVAQLLLYVVSQHGEPVRVAEAALASLGYMATNSLAWRPILQACVPDLLKRIRDPQMVEATSAYRRSLLWALAVLGRIPVVLEEMQTQASSGELQEAALSAIVDVLEAHSDSISDPDVGVDPQQVPVAIATVASAMRRHQLQWNVQRFGSRAMGLLCSALPDHQDPPEEALDAILAALRNHPDEYKVASGASSALRALLEKQRGQDSRLGCVADLLTKKGAVAGLQGILKAFSSSTCADREMLEDALYALTLCSGLGATLEVIAASDQSHVSLRWAGVKALFELGKAFPKLQEMYPGAGVPNICSAISSDARSMREDPTLPASDREVLESLLGNAELLAGMLRVHRS